MAQLPTDEDGNVVYTEVKELEGQTKKQLYDKAKFWIVSTLKSGDNMVELGGENSDQIVGTGNLLLGEIALPAGEVRNATLNFKFIVFVKEGRYKYEVRNFTFRYLAYLDIYNERLVDTGIKDIDIPYGSSKKRDEARSILTKTIDDNIKSLINSFKESMQESRSDDW